VQGGRFGLTPAQSFQDVQVGQAQTGHASITLKSCPGMNIWPGDSPKPRHHGTGRDHCRNLERVVRRRPELLAVELVPVVLALRLPPRSHTRCACRARGFARMGAL
jgi:hypothetical protein